MMRRTYMKSEWQKVQRNHHSPGLSVAYALADRRYMEASCKAFLITTTMLLQTEIVGGSLPRFHQRFPKKSQRFLRIPADPQWVHKKHPIPCFRLRSSAFRLHLAVISMIYICHWIVHLKKANSMLGAFHHQKGEKRTSQVPSKGQNAATSMTQSQLQRQNLDTYFLKTL